MKKNILIFCTVLAAFSLTAFGYLNWSNPQPAEMDLVYNVDSRFIATITKEDLHKAKSVADITPEKAEWDKISFLNMKVAILQDDGEIAELGDDGVLNADQIKLLQSTDYSTNFYMEGRGKRKGAGPEGLKDLDQEEFNLAYYITIVPEQEAEYAGGQKALIDYLKINSQIYTSIIEEDQLRPGQVSFTVTKAGTIGKVELNSTSGYPTIDEVLVGLVKNIPGKWHPAKNAKGERVDQELVFFFGRQGC